MAVVSGTAQDQTDVSVFYTLDSVSIEPATAVPEPASFLLIGSGLGIWGLVALRRKRNSPAAAKLELLQRLARRPGQTDYGQVASTVSPSTTS